MGEEGAKLKSQVQQVQRHGQVIIQFHATLASFNGKTLHLEYPKSLVQKCTAWISSADWRNTSNKSERAVLQKCFLAAPTIGDQVYSNALDEGYTEIQAQAFVRNGSLYRSVLEWS